MGTPSMMQVRSLLQLAHRPRVLSDRAGFASANGRYDSTYGPAGLRKFLTLKHSMLDHLAALILNNIKDSPLWDGLATAEQKRLRYLSRQVLARDMLQKQTVQRIDALLTKHGIFALLLKGAAFSGTIYNAHAPRGASDIDILVMEKDRKVVWELLATFTYIVPDPIYDSSSCIADSYHPTRFQWGARDNQTDYLIELHTALTHPQLFMIDCAELFVSSIPHPDYLFATKQIQGDDKSAKGKQNKKNANNEKFSSMLRVMSPEYNLINLALHAFRDLSLFNHGLVDGAAILTKQPIDFSKLFSSAAQYGCSAILLLWLEALGMILAEEERDWLYRQIEEMQNETQGIFVGRKLRAKALGVILAAKDKRPPRYKGSQYRVLQLLSMLVGPDNVSQPLGYIKARAKLSTHRPYFT